MVEKSSSLSAKRNYDAMHSHHQTMLRLLNDLYIEARVVVQALKKITDDSSDDSLDISVPSTTAASTKIKRTKRQLSEIVKREIGRREYEKTIVLIVSLIEDYIMSYARLLLRSFPERISKSTKGNEGKLSVDLIELIKTGAEQIIENNISMRLQAATFASPREYTSYLNALLGKPLQQDVLIGYLEIKASRDIIVHAQNIVNERYIEKAGADARAKYGEMLPINEAYFKSVVRTAKQLSASVYRVMMSEYGDNERVESVLKTKGI